MTLEISLETEKRVAELLAEAREIMRALELKFDDSAEDLVLSLMLTGLGLLKAHKRQADEVKAAAEIALRIQEGPRPGPEEAGLN